MFADLASIRPRICPKTLGRHGFGVGSKSATTLSKINQSSGTRQKPTSSVNLQRSARPWAWKNTSRAFDWSAYRRTGKITHSEFSSTKFQKFFPFWGAQAAGLLVSAASRNGLLQNIGHGHARIISDSSKTIRLSESCLILSSIRRYVFPDHILQIPSRRMISIRPSRHPDLDRVNLIQSFLGANIVFSHEKHNALNKPECVIQQ